MCCQVLNWKIQVIFQQSLGVDHLKEATQEKESSEMFNRMSHAKGPPTNIVSWNRTGEAQRAKEALGYGIWTLMGCAQYPWVDIFPDEHPVISLTIHLHVCLKLAGLAAKQWWDSTVGILSQFSSEMWIRVHWPRSACPFHRVWHSTENSMHHENVSGTKLKNMEGRISISRQRKICTLEMNSLPALTFSLQTPRPRILAPSNLFQ